MCGIGGVHDPGGGGHDACRAMLATIEHRGPDSWGIHVEGPAAIGQNRLAIIDLVTGDPPIATPDGRIGVAFNGEIYSYRALRAELLADGHELRTQGDTEVVAHLHERLTPIAAAQALDGMFAYAVWDARHRRLVLARDRLGKKPLYYWHDGDRFVFGSEIKVVLAHPDVPRRPREASIAAHLTFGCTPTPDTFFDGIRSVPPGHVLVFEHGSATLAPYWEPPLVRPGGAARLELDLPGAARLVRETLHAAVEKRLVSDVPIGAFLSGGVDSTAIVAIMARLQGGSQVNTFTAGFDDPHGYDEREPARRTATLLGTNHHEFVVRPDLEALLDRLVWHHDQPFGDSSALPTYLLAEQTRRHVTVALSGDGGDEAFAGYERFTAAKLVAAWLRMPASLRRGVGASVQRVTTSSPKHLFRKLQRFVVPGTTDVLDAYLSWLALTDADRRSSLLGRRDDDALHHARAIWDRSAGAALDDRLLDLNVRTYLLDDLLPKADRMSMAHGLEVRSPLLDHRLIEVAMRLPPTTRARGWRRKRVLRAAVEDIVPEHVFRTPKRGFAVPLDRWFRDDLRGWVHGLLGPGARVRAHLGGEGVDEVLGAQDHGEHHGQLLFALLTLEAFLRREDW